MSTLNNTTNIAVVEDHILIRSALCELIKGFDRYNVIYEASNGKDFINKLDPKTLPDVVLMDIVMPEMDGYETTSWMQDKHPEVKVLALSVYGDDTAIIRMFKAGAKGYILKNCDPADLKEALYSVITKGFYYSELVTGSLIHGINDLNKEDNHFRDLIGLSKREITFLKLVCTELAYKEIADEMCVSPRTVDGYRDKLFQKLNVKTRVGLVMYTIKNGIVTLN